MIVKVMISKTPLESVPNDATTKDVPDFISVKLIGEEEIECGSQGYPDFV